MNDESGPLAQILRSQGKGSEDTVGWSSGERRGGGTSASESESEEEPDPTAVWESSGLLAIELGALGAAAGALNFLGESA